MRYILCVFILILASNSAYPQDDQHIDNFIVKENLIKNGKLAVIAADTSDRPLEQINGTYQFVINGFKQELRFNEGVAVTPNAIEKSIFVFIKHENQHGSHGKLYFIYKTDDGINPIKVSWLYLVLIPAAILLFAYTFKRFLTLGIVILIVFFIFNYNKGLGFENLFETITHGIRDFIR